MSSFEQLQKKINEIQMRNRRVEMDKAWETSWTRKTIIVILTYMIISIIFIIVKLPDPLKNALIPTIAFIISTLTINLGKKWWARYVYKNTQRHT